jgi:RNA polymerase sigma-70 factor (ECF subfamily)
LLAGDPEAFDQVYQEHRPRLFAFLVRLSGESALAEDLLQETFLRLARAAPTLAPDTRLRPWLFTVARNLFISHRRWALLDLAKLSELRMFASLQPAPPSPFSLVAASEAERRMEEAIAALPLHHREVVLLCAVERLEPSEAAGVLGLAPATVRKRLARARAIIRTEVAALDGEGDGKR